MIETRRRRETMVAIVKLRGFRDGGDGGGWSGNAVYGGGLRSEAVSMKGI